jgi:hypothetical protein
MPTSWKDKWQSFPQDGGTIVEFIDPRMVPADQCHLSLEGLTEYLAFYGG